MAVLPVETIQGERRPPRRLYFKPERTIDGTFAGDPSNAYFDAAGKQRGYWTMLGFGRNHSMAVIHEEEGDALRTPLYDEKGYVRFENASAALQATVPPHLAVDAKVTPPAGAALATAGK